MFAIYHIFMSSNIYEISITLLGHYFNLCAIRTLYAGGIYSIHDKGVERRRQRWKERSMEGRQGEGGGLARQGRERERERERERGWLFV